MEIAEKIRSFQMPMPDGPRMPLTSEERQGERERIAREHGFDIFQMFPAALEMEICYGVTPPHPSLIDIYESGCAEPWTTQVVTSLLIASNQRNVLEIGGFTGQTSAWLACALERLGGGTLTVLEIDPERAQMVLDRVNGLELKNVSVRTILGDSLTTIPQLPDQSVGFVWQDGNHTKFHVEAEINALWRKMKPKGIISGHDVWGSCDLQTVYRKYGGIALDLPRLGQAGGIGIIQLP